MKNIISYIVFLSFFLQAITLGSGFITGGGGGGGGPDTTSIARDGSRPPTANIDWGSFAITGLSFTDVLNGAYSAHKYSNDVFGTGQNFFKGRGTSGTPLSILSGDELGAFQFFGYDGSTFGNAQGYANVTATENWTGSAKGTKWSFNSTIDGTTFMLPFWEIGGATGAPGNGAAASRLSRNFLGGHTLFIQNGGLDLSILAFTPSETTHIAQNAGNLYFRSSGSTPLLLSGTSSTFGGDVQVNPATGGAQAVVTIGTAAAGESGILHLKSGTGQPSGITFGTADFSGPNISHDGAGGIYLRAGDGSINNLSLSPGGNVNLGGGGLLCVSDGSCQFGLDGDNRPSFIYVKNDVKVSGNIIADTAGGGLSLKEGSNAKMGQDTLVGGTVTVSNTVVTANSRIFLTCNDPNGGTPGSEYVSARNAGADFTITSTNVLDTCNVSWMIVEPN